MFKKKKTKLRKYYYSTWTRPSQRKKKIEIFKTCKCTVFRQISAVVILFNLEYNNYTEDDFDFLEPYEAYYTQYVGRIKREFLVLHHYAISFRQEGRRRRYRLP